MARFDLHDVGRLSNSVRMRVALRCVALRVSYRSFKEWDVVRCVDTDCASKLVHRSRRKLARMDDVLELVEQSLILRAAVDLVLRVLNWEIEIERRPFRNIFNIQHTHARVKFLPDANFSSSNV